MAFHQKKGWHRNPILLAAVRILFGVFFIFTGLLKMIEPREELEALIGTYQIFPEVVIPYISLTLPLIELALGTFLALGFLTILAAWSGALLLLGFTLALGYTIVMGIDLKDCGCFGSIGLQQSGPEAFIRNMILLVIYSLILFNPARTWSLDSYLERKSLLV